MGAWVLINARWYKCFRPAASGQGLEANIKYAAGPPLARACSENTSRRNGQAEQILQLYNMAGKGWGQDVAIYRLPEGHP